MSIIHTDRTKNKAIGWSAEEDWKDTQDFLAKFADLKPTAPDVKTYFTNDYLSEAPYLPKK